MCETTCALIDLLGELSYLKRAQMAIMGSGGGGGTDRTYVPDAHAAADIKEYRSPAP